VIEKQKVVIDELKNKLHVEDFEHLDKLRSVLFVCYIILLNISVFILLIQILMLMIYRVQQKSKLLEFFAIFSATAWSFVRIFYRFIYYYVRHPNAK